MAKKDLKKDSPADIKKRIEDLLEQKKIEKQALLKVLNFFEEKSGNITTNDTNTN